jgi:hypothetical protein
MGIRGQTTHRDVLSTRRISLVATHAVGTTYLPIEWRNLITGTWMGTRGEMGQLHRGAQPCTSLLVEDHRAELLR